MKSEYTLIRPSRKTLSPEITCDVAVMVCAPKRYPQGKIDLFITQRESWIQSALERWHSRTEQHLESSDEQRRQLIRRAKEILPERIIYYSGLTELYPTGITVTEAVSCFGSCSPKSRLCFSWRLMQYLVHTVDYVVVHELAHIHHKDHGRDFYALVQLILSDYRERWQLLKERYRFEGKMLEAVIFLYEK